MAMCPLCDKIRVLSYFIMFSVYYGLQPFCQELFGNLAMAFATKDFQNTKEN